MIRSGIANLPLHRVTCPRWLFPRMKKLAGAISEVLIYEYGSEEFLRRLADPYWFQSLGCVIGYDWHSSGLSTTTLVALKESLNNKNLGIKIAGGKGKTSRKTPNEIEEFGDKLNLSYSRIDRLKYSSKITAKVDNSLVQDGYQLYAHSFVFTEDGRKYAVVQQGLNHSNRYARRYHWLSDNIESFVVEPHSAICSDKKENNVLDMTSRESLETQKVSIDLVKDNPKHLEKYIKNPIQKTLFNFEHFTMPSRHFIINMDKRNFETLKKAHEIQPSNYEELLAIEGIGPKTIRSLALISQLIYGTKASWKDPVNHGFNCRELSDSVTKFTFAFGGKDAVPYPIDRKHYDNTTDILISAIQDAKIGNGEKLHAIKRLNHYLKY